MTLSLAWWLYDQAPDTPIVKYGAAVGAAHLAAMPYHSIGKASNLLARYNFGVHNQLVSQSHYNYMTKHGMKISSSSHALFSSRGVGGSRSFLLDDLRFMGRGATKHYYTRHGAVGARALRIGGKLGARLIPGLGWALLAYDVYTVTNMILD